MPATLRVTHTAIGAEVRRNPYDIEVDGVQVGSVKMNETFELAIDAGPHTVRVHDGRKSSRARDFAATDGQVSAFRCTGKRFLPVFLASFVFPGLALVLVRQ